MNGALSSAKEGLPEGIENIALINIMRQMNTHYGADASLIVESWFQQGTTVVLSMPGFDYAIREW